MTIRDKVAGIIADNLGVRTEEIVPEASFLDDLGADSLDSIEIIMNLEEEFGIEIPDVDVEKMLLVGDIFKYLEEKVKGR